MWHLPHVGSFYFQKRHLGAPVRIIPSIPAICVHPIVQDQTATVLDSPSEACNYVAGVSIPIARTI